MYVSANYHRAPDVADPVTNFLSMAALALVAIIPAIATVAIWAPALAIWGAVRLVRRWRGREDGPSAPALDPSEAPTREYAGGWPAPANL
jgi:hypothetical protein